MGGSGATTRRRAVLDRAWSVPRQVHGARVAVVSCPGEGSRVEADALVSAHESAALAVLVADCVPIALASPEGVMAAVHAGWRGLTAGVVGASADSMRDLGAGELYAAVGPSARAECYEFGERDLDELAGVLGPAVRAVTSVGSAALDLRAAARAALGAAGAEIVLDAPACTVCDPGLWSHREERARERQAVVVWRDRTGRRTHRRGLLARGGQGDARFRARE